MNDSELLFQESALQDPAGLAFDDFVRPVPSESSRTDALSFHFGWCLCDEVIRSALQARAALANVAASHATHARLRRRISLLDVAVLGGQCAVAADLAGLGVSSALGTRALAAYLLVEESVAGVAGEETVGSYKLDRAAAEAAAAAGFPIEAMCLDVCQIVFSYPMRKSTRSLDLIDVAICLGQADLAERLAALIANRVGPFVMASGLSESHLDCKETLIPLNESQLDGRGDKVGQKKAFPGSKTDRRMAAAATAAVLDLVRAKERPSYMVLLAQWGRCWTRKCLGSLELCHMELLNHIYEYALPRTLLTLRHVLRHVNAQPELTPLSSLANASPTEVAQAVRSWWAVRASSTPNPLLCVNPTLSSTSSSDTNAEPQA